MAGNYLDGVARKKAVYLLEHLDKWICEPKFPSLLHGDLWSGNYMILADGVPALIDPAVYVGDAMADMAMTELFGGFGADFYSGYNDENPLPDHYRDIKDLYNLYHMLNHLNLFGSGYYGSVMRIIGEYV